MSGHTAAVARIDGEAVEFHLEGRTGDWNWLCPGGQRASYGAGGATKAAALKNLEINLRDEEPGFETIAWRV